MAEQFKKDSSKLWKQEPVTFSYFAIEPSIELVNLVKKIPAKFQKKSEFLVEESQAYMATTVKSVEVRGIEASEETTLLDLKSGDNGKAAVLSEYIKTRYKSSLDIVRHILFLTKLSEMYFDTQ